MAAFEQRYSVKGEIAEMQAAKGRMERTHGPHADRPGCTFRAECGTSMTRRAALLDDLSLDFATSLTNIDRAGEP